jgi:ketosteroid isomerase-like protein
MINPVPRLLSLFKLLAGLAGLGLVILLPGCTALAPDHGSVGRGSSSKQFRTVLTELADAWNKGDALRAANCFTEDAIYTQPPQKQVYRGRDALYRFFGGDSGRAGQMEMTWHHLAFDLRTQIGFGEFSFTYGTTAHGVAVIRMREGKISNWREYWYESALRWPRFVEPNPF